MEHGVQVLLVEDDVGFAGLLEEWLTDIQTGADALHPPHIRLVQVDNLENALEKMASETFDILLVDLNLPDSCGLDTFDRIAQYAADFPIIVLSGLDDESLAIQAVRRGAQDYLVKNVIDGNLLLRSVRYAMERHRLHRELERVRELERRQREQSSLDRLADRNVSQVSARMLGLRGLKQGYPDVFDRIVQRVGAALEKLLRMRTYKVILNISDELKDIAADLVFLRCGPRDVVDIYMSTLGKWEVPNNPTRNEVIHEECRYLAFELMGHLVALYRLHALGGNG
jgi:DNA-binding response OmpR family regulator